MLTAMLVLLLLGVAPQHPPKEDSKEPKRGDSVVARGCLTGNVLESTDLSVRDPGGNLHHYVTFRLTGDKELLEQIRKEHSGHLDIVHGVLKTVPPTTTVRRRQLGKTGISIGIGTSRTAVNEPAPPMPVLEARELEHTEVLCGQRK